MKAEPDASVLNQTAKNETGDFAQFYAENLHRCLSGQRGALPALGVDWLVITTSTPARAELMLLNVSLPYFDNHLS
jgi:hypothetical protein